jgi:hypothetical protein
MLWEDEIIMFLFSNGYLFREIQLEWDIPNAERILM